MLEAGASAGWEEAAPKAGSVGGEDRCSGVLLGASPRRWPPEELVLREVTEPK